MVQTPKTTSWVVRKILASKKLLLKGQNTQGLLGATFTDVQKDDSFSIQKMYISLMPEYTKVKWKSLMLQNSPHPRFKFTLWLAVQQRLATVGRLLKFGMHVPPDCVYCGRTLELLI